jgi:hypothetical protein
MKGDAPRSAVSPQLGITTHEQEQPLQQGRGYVASRNEKLHLIARQKRQPIRASAGDAAVDKQSAAAAGRNAVRRSLPNLARPKVVKLSAVLQQAPQHFDRVKVSAGYVEHGTVRLVNTAQQKCTPVVPNLSCPAVLAALCWTPRAAAHACDAVTTAMLPTCAGCCCGAYADRH